MALQPYYRPTGSLLVPLSTQVLVGDSVSGPGILLGTTVVSITEVLGSPAIGNYLKITLSQEPSGFSAVSVPTGVTNHGHQSTSALTGHNLGYTSHITFTRGEGGSDFVDKTLSFKEDVKGWVSFKSFIPENGLSCANEYYTFSNARLWQHNREDVDRNTFYKDDTNDGFTNSLCTVLLNNNSGVVKSFNTLNYEGTQSRIQVPTANDSEYFNLRDKDGWFVSGVSTDKEEGSLNEFIEKEGKWFNYIKGVRTEVQSASDLAGFNVQGIGVITSGGSGGGSGSGGNLFEPSFSQMTLDDVGTCIAPGQPYNITWTGGDTNPSVQTLYISVHEKPNGATSWEVHDINAWGLVNTGTYTLNIPPVAAGVTDWPNTIAPDSQWRFYIDDRVWEYDRSGETINGITYTYTSEFNDFNEWTLCPPLTNIPDANFRSRLTSGYGVSFNVDNDCLTSDINTITAMTINSASITDLTGIEAFTALTYLACAGNDLTSLDVSNNLALTVLNCWDNNLTSLDVSGATALTTLTCSSNDLASIDVSNNIALTSFQCWGNQLTSLDVSANTVLETLNCNGNNITGALELQYNTNLLIVLCSDNSIIVLNLKNGNNTNMTAIQAPLLGTAYTNSDLTCIVDDISYSTNNWTAGNGFYFPSNVTFSL